MVEHTSLCYLKCWPMWVVDNKPISILAVVGHRVIFLDQAEEQVVSYSLGVIPYRIIISGEFTIFLLCVAPSLQWTRRYFPLGASLVFERYFPLMNALHVDWLSRRHKFSLIPFSTAAARMVSPTLIILKLPFFILLLIGSVCGTSCVDGWQKTRPVYCGFAPFLCGVSHHETARSVFEFHQCFLVSSTRGIVGRFLLFNLPECLFILFEIGLSCSITVSGIMAFLSTVIASNVIQITTGSLILLFSVAFIVPSFPVLYKHELIDDPIGLIIYIRVVIRLIV